YITLCCVCKIAPVDVDKLSAEPRSRFCSENCRKEAYALGLFDREKCRHCGISPRLVLSNGRKVDYCGMTCRKEAEKQKSSGHSKSLSYNNSSNNKRSSVNLMLTPDKPAYQPKSKPTPLLQNNGPSIKASKSYDNLLSTSSRPTPKRSLSPTKRNSLNSYSSPFLTAPPHHSFQPRSPRSSLSLRSPSPTKRIKPPSPKSHSSHSNHSSRSPTPIKRRSINDVDSLISVKPPSPKSHSSHSNHSSRSPTPIKR
ncbi:20261_t:CDS:2, partial [Racocetra persica]